MCLLTQHVDTQSTWGVSERALEVICYPVGDGVILKAMGNTLCKHVSSGELSFNFSPNSQEDTT